MKRNQINKIGLLVCLFLLGTSSIYGASKSYQKKIEGWYLRTVAEVTLDDQTFIHKTGGVFGNLKKAKAKKDVYDVPTYKDAIMNVIFTPKWEKEGVSYLSDYHRYRPYKPYRRQNWIFQVKNYRTVNLAEGTLKIKLEGPFAVIKGEEGYITTKLKNPEALLSKLRLKDLDNGDVYDYDDLKTLELDMDGLNTRTFRWILKK